MFEYELGNLSDIETRHYKYEEYKIVELNSKTDYLDKELYIQGHKIKNDPEITVHKSPIVLLDMLKLGQVIASTWDINKIMYNYKTQIVHSEEIIDMCHKYGLLYVDYNIKSRYQEPIEDCFSVRECKQLIYWLYITYKRWDILVSCSLEEIKKNDLFKHTHIETQEDIEIQKSKFITYGLNRIPAQFNPKINLGYNKGKKSYEIIVNADFPLSIAYFQLKLLLANQFTENSVITCKKCRNIVISKHGNTKYCDNCRMNQNRDDVKNHRTKLEDKAREYIYNKYSKLDIPPAQILDIENQYVKDNIGKSTPFNMKKIKEWLCIC